MNPIIEEIKTFFLQNNIPVFGIAGAESLQKEPLGYRPSDMLASAESILCFGIPVPRGVFKCEERSEWMYWRAANIYYRTIDAALTKTCSILEAKRGSCVSGLLCFFFFLKKKKKKYFVFFFVFAEE